MNLEINNLILKFRDFEYEIKSVQNVDGNYYDMITNQNTFCFDLSTTINGLKFNSVEEINTYLFG